MAGLPVARRGGAEAQGAAVAAVVAASGNAEFKQRFEELRRATSD